MFTRNNYGSDLRLLDSVLSATGFDSINFTPINIGQTDLPSIRKQRSFTPININQTDLPSTRKRRRVTYNDQSEMQPQRFQCNICGRAFPLKKTRDRHQESVHRKQFFPCSTCNQSFSRKDIRDRHQAEKHSGKRRGRELTIVSLEPNTEGCVQGEIQHSTQHYQQSRIDEDAVDIPYSMEVDIYSAKYLIDTDVEDLCIDDEVTVRIHDCTGSLSSIDSDAFNNPLLLCTNLLLRCKPYRRFFIHDKKRDLISRQNWNPPNTRFWKLYDLAIRTLSSRLASGARDIELLAGLVAFVNVDVLISGSERMGDHARAMYSMKAHHHAHRDPIFEALQAAFEHCGKTCRSLRIIYTKRGFVWMLNVRLHRLCLPLVCH